MNPAPPPVGPPGNWQAPIGVPPPPKRSSNKALIFVLASIGVFALVCIVGMAFFVSWVKGQVEKPITGHPNAGPPNILAQLPAGWVRARFKEFPLEIEIPGDPEAEELNLAGMSHSDQGTFKMGYDYLNYYYAGNDSYGVRITGQWLTGLAAAAFENDADLRELNQEHSDSGRLKDLKIEGAPSGSVVGFEKIEEGGETTINYSLLVKRERALIFVEMFGYDEKDRRKEFERVLRSIKFK